MKFQLVFQFEVRTIADFDRLTAIEESIYGYLRESREANLDGHDCGMGEFNIFIHCDDPEAKFAELAEFIDQTSPRLAFSAAYRAFSENEYTALWPPSLQNFSVA